MLLVGIVALNVVTLSYAASAGKTDERNQELSRENSVLQSLEAKKYGRRDRLDKAELGFATMMTSSPRWSGGEGRRRRHRRRAPRRVQAGPLPRPAKAKPGRAKAPPA